MYTTHVFCTQTPHVMQWHYCTGLHATGHCKWYPSAVFAALLSTVWWLFGGSVKIVEARLQALIMHHGDVHKTHRKVMNDTVRSHFDCIHTGVMRHLHHNFAPHVSIYF